MHIINYNWNVKINILVYHTINQLIPDSSYVTYVFMHCCLATKPCFESKVKQLLKCTKNASTFYGVLIDVYATYTLERRLNRTFHFILILYLRVQLNLGREIYATPFYTYPIINSRLTSQAFQATARSLHWLLSQES